MEDSYLSNGARNHKEEIKDQIASEKSEGNTNFLRAARDGNLNDVLEYLKGSTDINTSNANGLNALHLASKEGHIKIVEELLARGANIEAATKKGNTALHIGSLAGQAEVVKILVEHGSKVNAQSQNGFTPLYMASQENHADVVRYLLQHEAGASIATEDGFTPLAVALQQGHDKVVAVLLEHDTKGKVRLPALHIAAKKNDTKSAALLLQNEQNEVNIITKSGFTPLHIASHYGNVSVATLLIQKGANVNYKAKNNITPLHVAARWGKANMVTLLLDSGSNIEEKTRDGLTPLHCSARSGFDNVVDILLERGATHAAKTKNGLSPLHMSSQGDHVDCARLLLYHKAEVDDVTVDYLTPLHVAGHCGNVKIAKLLLDRKCDPNARALNGFTPLHIACKKNRFKVVELLLKYGASVEATTESGLTPLHVAAFMGYMNIAIFLIQHNANPDFTTVRGETALHLAARAKQTDIMRILLRNGATVDARAREQQTPLHIACRLGNIDNVVLLLQHGASPDAATKDLYTPLHIAAKEGHEEVATILLEHYASMNNTTKKGFTPLHVAAKYGNLQVAKILLAKHADPDVQGKNGLTPLHVATHYNFANVAQLLLENKASPHAAAKNGYTPLHIAAKKNQMDLATTLLEYGAKPGAESKNGFTPLHLASQEGHVDMVRLLLEHKADINTVSHNGLTPMHLAAQEDHVNVAEILVAYGSETDSQTKAGYTPLHTACHFGQINMVRYLLDHDASVSATTKLGYTPLHQAAQQGQVMIVQLLLKNNASPNAVTNAGQTPLSIAQKLGYVSVVDTLKHITEVTDVAPQIEDKYKVVAPETMQETLLSDSEDEGARSLRSASVVSARQSMSSLLHDSTSWYSFKEDEISKTDRMLTNGETENDDVTLRIRSAEDARRRLMSDIGATLDYPSYLEKAPDYEAEMRYYSGDTLSPTTRRTDAFFGEDLYARQSFRYGTGQRRLERPSQDGAEVWDYGYIHEVGPQIIDSPVTSKKQKDFIEPQIAAPTQVTPVQATEGTRVSSYSGSSFNTTFDPDNVVMQRPSVNTGFLVSFMVDARGGAMHGGRHSGIRIIIPPKKATCPTRVTCRFLKRETLLHPPPLKEGEALATRILEMGPIGVSFLGPVVLEVPHFASLRGREREIVVMRSDDGKAWIEHPVAATDEIVSEALGSSVDELDNTEDWTSKRVCRIVTQDFPHYFAVVSRIRQDSCMIGPEGGVLSSSVVPQVQAVFSEGAVTKLIKVGLQAQPIPSDLVVKLLGNRVAVSPVVTLEPRRRQFHKPITITIPVPQAALKGMLNQYGDQSQAPSLRLLCSLVGGQQLAVWEDITRQTEITFVNDCVQFMTAVSARFWLFDCHNINESTRMATELYRESVAVPFMSTFVVFAKRHAIEEGQLRMFCMTDDKVDKTLEKQEQFEEVARSREVEVLEGKPQYLEMAGNLVPVTKSGDQLSVVFRSFHENRLPCTVRVRDPDHEPSARVAFMKEPKVSRTESPQTPVCNLTVSLPELIKTESREIIQKKASDHSRPQTSLREMGLVLEDSTSKMQIKLSDVADTLQGDWVILAQQLDVTISDINRFKTEHETVSDQALAMLHHWVNTNPHTATSNELEMALIRINRGDVIRRCIFFTDDAVDQAANRVTMDQSGFDALTEEMGVSQEPSDRNIIIEEEEQDLIKESESVVEDSSSETGSDKRRSVIEVEGFDITGQPLAAGGTEDDVNFTQFVESLKSDGEQVPSYDTGGDSRGDIIASVSTRHPVASPTLEKSPAEKDAAFNDLISGLSASLSEDEPPSQAQERLDYRAEVEENQHQPETRQIPLDETFTRLEHLNVEQRPKQADIEPAEVIIFEPDFQPAMDEEEQTTEIEEIYHTDDGVTRKTLRKITLIGPEGTSERVEVLREEPVNPEDVDLTQSTEDGLVESGQEPATTESSMVTPDLGLTQPEERREVENSEEMRDDGTVVRTQKVRSHSVRRLRRSVSLDDGNDVILEEDIPIPGSEKEETIEVMEEPPRFQVRLEDVEEPSDDGSFVKRQIIHNRMVKKVITRRSSIDAIGRVEEEEYEIDEIIPGTESSFIKSSSPSTMSENADNEIDEEIERTRHMSRDVVVFKHIKDDGTIVRHRKEIYPDNTYKDIIEERGVPTEKQNVEEFEETLEDGTIHKTKILRTFQVRRVKKRIESTDSEDRHIFEGLEEVPDSSSIELLSSEPMVNVVVPETDEDITEILPSGNVLQRTVRRERTGLGENDSDVRDISTMDLLSPEKTKKQTEYDITEDLLDDGSIITSRQTVVEEITTCRSRTGSPELIKDRIIISEKELAPSPRASPFGSREDLREIDLRKDDDEYLVRKIKKSQLSETFTGDNVQEEYTVTHHLFDRSQLEKKLKVLSEATPVITITEDNSPPCDEDDFVNYYGLDPTKQAENEAADKQRDDFDGTSRDAPGPSTFEEDRVSSSSSDVGQHDELAADKVGQSDPDDPSVKMDTAKISLKKQIHTRTVVDRDGAPHTIVTEDVSVHEDTQGTDDFKHSMQKIMDDFVSSSGSQVDDGQR